MFSCLDLRDMLVVGILKLLSGNVSFLLSLIDGQHVLITTFGISKGFLFAAL